MIGKNLDRYRIIEELGQGGMATVYRAHDKRLDTDVAIKVIRVETLAPNVLDTTLLRFEREAKLLAKLTHPNIVKVTDFGEFENLPYLVMPFLQGGTLKQIMGYTFHWRDAFQMLLPIVSALDYAHSQSMIHRDVKPANILLTKQQQAVLTDFGIAKILDPDSSMDITSSSATIGTPQYMAPEQATSKTIDHRVDMYAVGVVLFEMVTGRMPFTADTPMEVLLKHITEPLPKPTRFVPDLPSEVENILVKALAKQPNDRYENMADFHNAMLAELMQAGNSAQSTAIPMREETVPEIRPEDASNVHLTEPSTVSDKTLAANTRNIDIRAIAVAGLVTLIIAGYFVFGLPSFSTASTAQPATVTTTGLLPPANTVTPPLLTAIVEPTMTIFISPAPTETIVLPIATSGPGIGSTFTFEKDGMVLVYVPEGEFILGNGQTAYLGAYWIDQTEVTNHMYALCVDNFGCREPKQKNSYSYSPYYDNSDFENYPVVNIEQGDAEAYCSWANRRLPTETEWEKAARGTDGRTYPWGEGISCYLANYYDGTNYCAHDTQQVGANPDGASPYGALDMAGNVWEWVADPPGNNDDYPGPRGGGWRSNAINLTTFSISKSNPSYAYDIGFRCAYSISEN